MVCHHHVDIDGHIIVINYPAPHIIGMPLIEVIQNVTESINISHSLYFPFIKAAIKLIIRDIMFCGLSGHIIDHIRDSNQYCDSVLFVLVDESIPNENYKELMLSRFLHTNICTELYKEIDWITDF